MHDVESKKLEWTGPVRYESSGGCTPSVEAKCEAELFFKDGVPVMIEMVVTFPNGEDDVEHIGLGFEGKTLVDYDGVISFPPQIIPWMEGMGYDMTEAKD